MPDEPETREAESKAEAPSPIPDRERVRKPLIRVGIALAAVVSLTVTLAILKPSVTFKAVHKPVAEMSNAEKAAYAEKIKAQVAKNMLMPEETPEIIPAADQYSELLNSGLFWHNLERDDLILVFSETDPWVVIWRPSKKLIVNVGPIVDDGTEAPQEEIAP